jgi:hypothetical protein
LTAMEIYSPVKPAAMKQILSIFLLLFSCSPNSGTTENETAKRASAPVKMARKKDMSDPSNTLTGKTETLQLCYIVWGCACANWVTPGDLEKYQDKGLSKHAIFLEPASPELELPPSFDPSLHMVKVTGQFYVRPDYPKGTEESEEQLNKAKVFRYTKMTVLKRY